MGLHEHAITVMALTAIMTALIKCLNAPEHAQQTLAVTRITQITVTAIAGVNVLQSEHLEEHAVMVHGDVVLLLTQKYAVLQAEILHNAVE